MTLAAQMTFDAAWAWAGMIVVGGFLALIVVGWVLEFIRKHAVFIMIFILVVIVAAIIYGIGKATGG